MIKTKEIFDVNIQEIFGSWYKGYVLDKHMKNSELIGYDGSDRPIFNSERTDIGESIYQLKYKNDYNQIDLLANTFVANLKSKFNSINFIIPMPPSKNRKTQPLIELARAVAKKMNIPIFEKILVKKIKTLEVKNIPNDQRLNKLLEAFSLNSQIESHDYGDVLIIDDIYSSGASLKAASKTVQDYPMKNNIYVATFTKTKTS